MRSVRAAPRAPRSARTAGPIGRRERRKATTRQDLLRAGRALFSHKGLYESRVEEITRRADIGKGTLYRYFRNKEELIRAVVADGYESLGREVARRVAGAPDLDRTIAGMAAAHAEFFARNPDLMRIFHQVRGMLKFDRREWRLFRRSLRAHLEYLAGALGRVPELSEVPAPRRRELAALLFGSLSGTVSVRIAAEVEGGGERIPPRMVQALVAMARGFVRATRTGAGRAAPPRRIAAGRAAPR